MTEELKQTLLFLSKHIVRVAVENDIILFEYDEENEQYVLALDNCNEKLFQTLDFIIDDILPIADDNFAKTNYWFTNILLDEYQKY